MNFRNFVNIYQLIFVIFIFLSVQGDDTTSRTFEYYLNPGCHAQCEEYNINIVYIRAAGKNDVLHILYAGGNITETLSSVIIRSNNLTSKVSINWDILTNPSNESLFNSIKLNGDEFPSIFGMIFTKLYASNKNNNTLEWDFSDFEWTLASKKEKVHENTKIIFKAIRLKNENKYQLFSKNGSISVEFSYSNKSKPNERMPRLLFNSNNIQFNLVLTNLSFPDFTNPCFIFQFVLANRLDSGKMTLENIPSIDDESSPGVFRVLNFYGQDSSAKPENKTYIQWKPVCYSVIDSYGHNSIITTNKSTPVKLSNDFYFTETIEVIQKSLAYIVLGENVIKTNSSASLLNITFGDIDDKPYASAYNIWTASFGYGNPPVYELSITIILIISLGLGLPFLIIVAGSIYLVIKKRLRNHRLTYVSIDEHIN